MDTMSLGICWTYTDRHHRFSGVPLEFFGGLRMRSSKAFRVTTILLLAFLSSRAIASATGSFDVVNVTSETNLGSPDTYSLQLNSEYFDTPACAGAANPANCKGWQQFIY